MIIIFWSWSSIRPVMTSRSTFLNFFWHVISPLTTVSEWEWRCFIFCLNFIFLIFISLFCNRIVNNLCLFLSFFFFLDSFFLFFSSFLFIFSWCFFFLLLWCFFFLFFFLFFFFLFFFGFFFLGFLFLLFLFFFGWFSFLWLLFCWSSSLDFLWGFSRFFNFGSFLKNFLSFFTWSRFSSSGSWGITFNFCWFFLNCNFLFFMMFFMVMFMMKGNCFSSINNT